MSYLFEQSTHFSFGGQTVVENVPLEIRDRIEPVLDDFERRLRQEKNIRIEDWLENENSDPSYLFKQLLAVEVGFKISSGEPLKIAAYQARFPKFAKDVESVFSDLMDNETCDEATAVYEKEKKFSTPTRWIGANYKVIRRLGQGAFADVFHCVNERIDRECAVKIPRSDRQFSDYQLEQFANEGKSLAQFKHPGIVQVYHVGNTNDQPFIEAEFIDGETLQGMLAREKPSFERTAKIAIAIADALACAHEQQVFHRDLKPANILIDKKGNPFVADFGLALTRDEQSDRRGEFAGTPSFMAPEQHRGESETIDGRSDLWSFGVIIYRMVTGKMPFKGLQDGTLVHEIINRPLTPPRQLDNSIPAVFDEVCGRCLNKDPNARYSTAADIAVRLKEWLTTLEESSSQPTSVQPSQSSNVYVWALLFVPLLSLAIWQITKWQITKTSPEPKPLASKQSPPVPVIFDPHKIDEWATIRRWEPLLKTEPIPIIHPLGVQGSVKSHDPILEEFSVDVAALSMHSLGYTESQDYNIRVNVARNRWQGACGVFWGYSEIMPGEIATFNAIVFNHSLGQFTLDHGATIFELREGKLPNIEGPYGKHKSIPINKPGFLEHDLELRIKNGQLVGVLYDKQPLELSPTNGFIPECADHGRFGVICENGSVVFRGPKFQLLEARKTDEDG